MDKPNRPRFSLLDGEPKRAILLTDAGIEILDRIVGDKVTSDCSSREEAVAALLWDAHLMLEDNGIKRSG